MQGGYKLCIPCIGDLDTKLTGYVYGQDKRVAQFPLMDGATARKYLSTQGHEQGAITVAQEVLKHEQAILKLLGQTAEVHLLINSDIGGTDAGFDGVLNATSAVHKNGGKVIAYCGQDVVSTAANVMTAASRGESVHALDSTRIKFHLPQLRTELGTIEQLAALSGLGSAQELAENHRVRQQKAVQHVVQFVGPRALSVNNEAWQMAGRQIEAAFYNDPVFAHENVLAIIAHITRLSRGEETEAHTLTYKAAARAAEGKYKDGADLVLEGATLKDWNLAKTYRTVAEMRTQFETLFNPGEAKKQPNPWDDFFMALAVVERARLSGLNAAATTDADGNISFGLPPDQMHRVEELMAIMQQL